MTTVKVTKYHSATRIPKGRFVGKLVFRFGPDVAIEPAARLS
jgi:hypothetical protein